MEKFILKIRVRILIILCLAFLHSAKGQITFQRGYTGTDSKRLFAVQQTSDGKSIAAGNSYPGNFPNICLVKTDINGDTLWTKTYSGTDYFYCNAMQQTSDNGFLLGGMSQDTNSNNSKMLLIKTDVNGNLTWCKTYGDTNSRNIFALKQAANGDFIIAGYNSVLRLSPSGNIIWSKKLTDSKFFTSIFGIDNTSDNGIILTGTTDTLAGYYKVYLLKLNSAGNLIWNKAYGGPYGLDDHGFSIQQTSDKGFIITGQTFVPAGPNSEINDIYLLKADSLGNLKWSKKFGGSANDLATAVKQTSDNGFILTGSSTSFVGNGLYQSNTFLIKTNNNGIVSWCKYYGSVGHDEAKALSVTSDGGYIVSGITADNFGYPDNLYILKTDSSGNTNCNGYNWPLYDSTYSSNTYTLSQSITSITLSVNNPTVSTKHLNSAYYDPCTVGIKEPNVNIELKLFPNPNNGTFKLKTNTEMDDAELILFNTLGQNVFSQKIWRGESEIKTQSLSKGLYHYSVLQNKTIIQTGKIVIE